MSELFIEFFSEEIPPSLQISARNQFQKILIDKLSEANLKYNNFEIYSTPTRIAACISGLPDKIKILPAEIKGPKVGVPEKVLENFAKSRFVSLSDLYEKKTEKGNFYFVKIKGKEINSEEELIKCILKSLSEISWKKSMKWSDHEMSWGRPLRSILAIFGNKVLKFNYQHLEATNFMQIEENSTITQKKINNFNRFFLNYIIINIIIFQNSLNIISCFFKFYQFNPINIINFFFLRVFINFFPISNPFGSSVICSNCKRVCAIVFKN